MFSPAMAPITAMIRRAAIGSSIENKDQHRREHEHEGSHQRPKHAWPGKGQEDAPRKTQSVIPGSPEISAVCPAIFRSVAIRDSIVPLRFVEVALTHSSACINRVFYRILSVALHGVHQFIGHPGGNAGGFLVGFV